MNAVAANPRKGRTAVVRDHRVDVAEKKRLLMRTRLVDATMRVFADSEGAAPTIDDVIREAKVSRGTFYNYFTSLDEVLALIGQDLSNQMAAEILTIYDVLAEPWQRFSVGFRLFLLRAMLDRKWAGFITRSSAWEDGMPVARYMSRDLENGKAAGQFHFDDVGVAAGFLKGAATHAIQALRVGVEHPVRYIDFSVRMALASLGCDRARCDEGVTFSASYLRAWVSSESTFERPQWARDLNSKEGQDFLAAASR